jgi:ParB family chromosome partitioning protein
MEFKMMNPKDLVQNNYNPNEMVDSIYNHLKQEIQRVGFIDPVSVRKTKDGRLEIIDGEHRWRAALELGMKEIPVIILDMDESEARIQTINLNLIKGEFNPIKYAKLLTDLEIKYQEDDLLKYLNMSKTELESYKLLLNLSENIDEEDVRGMKPVNKYELTFTFKTKEEMDTVNDALKLVEGKDRNTKLVRICEDYLNQHGDKVQYIPSVHESDTEDTE